MERLGKKDKAVIRAFTERRAMDGHKLTTDGTRLDIYSLGGSDIAHWKDGKIHFPGTHGSRSGQLVERAVAREAPKNDLYNRRGYNPDTWKPGDVVQTTAKFEKAMRTAGSRPVKRRGVVIYAEAGSPFVFVVEDDGRAGYMRSDALEPQRGARTVSKGEIDALVRENAFAIAGEEWGEQNPRSRNTHDPRQSSREFRAAVDRANEQILEAAAAGERGDAARMIDHTISAASWVGRAGAELKYSADVEPSVKRDYDALAKGLRSWGGTVVRYMREEMGIAANPVKGSQYDLADAVYRIQTEAALLNKTGQDPGRVQLYMGSHPDRWFATYEFYPDDSGEYETLGASKGRDAASAIRGLASDLTKRAVTSARPTLHVVENPRAKNVSTSTAACTVGASAHKTRSAAARQCGAKWKASKEKFASTGGKAAARSPKSPIGKRGKRKRRSR